MLKELAKAGFVELRPGPGDSPASRVVAALGVEDFALRLRVLKRLRLLDPAQTSAVKPYVDNNYFQHELMVVVTDGRATAGADAVARALAAAGLVARAGIHAVVVDCESGRVRLGLAADLAAAMGAAYLPLQQVAADALTATVREATFGGRERRAA